MSIYLLVNLYHIFDPMFCTKNKIIKCAGPVLNLIQIQIFPAKLQLWRLLSDRAERWTDSDGL